MLVIKRPIKKLVKDAKAISPIVATLLLIAIAVAASVITYSWVMAMISSQSQQAQTQIRIDNVQFINSTSIILTIRNMGSVTATIESVSVTESGKTTFTATLVSRKVIPTGTAADYTFKAGLDNVPSSWTWSFQKSYVIRATTTTGFYYELVKDSPLS